MEYHLEIVVLHKTNVHSNEGSPVLIKKIQRIKEILFKKTMNTKSYVENHFSKGDNFPLTIQQSKGNIHALCKR